jgi:signal transduction histidine kinase
MRITRRRLIGGGRLVIIALPILLMVALIPLFIDSGTSLPRRDAALLAVGGAGVGWVWFWMRAVGRRPSVGLYLALAVYTVLLVLITILLPLQGVGFLALGASLIGASLPLRQGILGVCIVSALGLLVTIAGDGPLPVGVGVLVNELLAGTVAIAARQGAIAYLKLEAARAEIARLYEQARTVAVLEERQRLSRELHDSVTQILNAIALAADAAQEQGGADEVPPKLRQFFEFVSTQARGAADEMRALVFNLRPELLAREGLIVALEQEVATLRSRHGLAVDFTRVDEPSVSLEVKEALYRIAQESMNNAAKHGAARRVAVSIERRTGALVLLVADDGRGFDPSVQRLGHLGLRSMRERAASLGGSVEVLSNPGRGTQVIAQIPAGA